MILVAVAMGLLAADRGFRIQPPAENSENFALSDPHCWLFPCRIDREPTAPWERHGARQISEPVLVPSITSEATIAAANEFGQVVRWPIDGPPEPPIFLPITGPVTALAIAPDGTITAANERGELARWPIDGPPEPATRRPIPGPFTALAIAPDGTIAAANERGELVRSPIDGPPEPPIRRPIPGPFTALAIAPDGTIAAANERGELVRWPIDGPPEPPIFLPIPGPITALAIAPDGTIAAANERGELVRWPIDGPPEPPIFLPIPGPITVLAIAPDGTIAAANEHGELVRSPIDGPPEPPIFLPIPGPITALAVTPLLTKVSIPTATHTPPQPDADNVEITVRLRPPTPTYALGLGPNGTVVTAHPAGKVLVWSASGTVLRELSLPPSTSPPTAVAAGPQSTTVTGYQDGAVVQWSPQGTPTQHFHLPSDDSVHALSVSPDGSVHAQARGGSSFVLSGPIVAALWSWVVLGFAITGCCFFFAPLLQVRATDKHHHGLEPDNPTNHPTKATESLQQLSRLLAGLVGNPNTFGPLSICVNGTWGSGKTSLITLLSNHLRNASCTCVFFDAWHHQNENSLFAALAEQIRQSWRPRISPTWPTGFVPSLSLFQKYQVYQDTILFFLYIWFRRFLQTPMSFFFFVVILLLAATAFAALLLHGIEILSGQTFLTGDKPSPKHYGHALLLITLLSGSSGLVLYLWNGPRNFLKPFAATPVSLVATSTGWFQFGQSSERLSFRYRFRQSFKEVCDALELLGRRLVIFIDDLDRCRQDHILEILEAVNFLTSSGGSCFVILAMDEARVKDELGHHYANSALTETHVRSPDQYLEKIINLTIAIPQPDVAQVLEIRKS